MNTPETPAQLPATPSPLSAHSPLSLHLREDDDRRITQAHQLHKQIGGNLVAALALLEMARLESGKRNASEEEARLCGRLEESLRQCLKDVRWLVEEQYPPLLKTFGLNAALQDLAHVVTAEFDGSVEFDLPEDDLPLPLPSRLNLYRIIENLVTRATTGGGVKRVHFALAAGGEGKARLVLTCDGGSALWRLDEPAPELQIVLERCALLGGTLECLPARPGGIPQICLSFPLPAFLPD